MWTAIVHRNNSPAPLYPLVLTAGSVSPPPTQSYIGYQGPNPLYAMNEFGSASAVAMGRGYILSGLYAWSGTDPAQQTQVLVGIGPSYAAVAADAFTSISFDDGNGHSFTLYRADSMSPNGEDNGDHRQWWWIVPADVYIVDLATVTLTFNY